MLVGGLCFFSGSRMRKGEVYNTATEDHFFGMVWQWHAHVR